MIDEIPAPLASNIIIIYWIAELEEVEMLRQCAMIQYRRFFKKGKLE
jgi:hypothetical protein